MNKMDTPRNPGKHKYLFVLSPPFSGSTLLWRILSTAKEVSALPQEGQFLPSVRNIMREGHWDEDKKMPWEYIKEQWRKEWDLGKSVFLEKSPPNIMRALEIEKYFRPSYFISINRNPYAFCEGYSRRRNKSCEIAIRWWVRFSEYQIRNITALKRNLFFKYEELMDNKENIAKKLNAFMPELNDIDINGTYKTRTARNDNIVNNPILPDLNAEKIKRLRKKDIEVINKVLKENVKTLKFFNYELL